jgi:hypothetical protein
MIQPGRETNLPTSSGFAGDKMNAQSSSVLGFQTGTRLITVDGFTLTLGMMVSIVLVLLIYTTFVKKGRR